MPGNPLPSDVFVNQPLTNVLISYMQQAKDFICPQVFPIVPVTLQSGIIQKYNKGDWLRLQAEVRGDAAETAGSGWKIDNTDTYFAKVYGIHKDVSDQVRSNQQGAIDMDRDAAEWCAQQLMIKMDSVFASSYMGSGKGWTDYTGGSSFTKWSTAGSTPIQDVRTASFTIKQNTGRMPNVLVLGADTYKILVDHADVLDRIKYTQRGIISPELLAPLFGVDKVAVALSVYTSSLEGASSDTQAYTCDSDGALLAYAAPRPSILQPSAGYCFVWIGYLGAANEFGSRIKRYRIERLAADRIEGESAFDCKLVASDCGAYFDDAVD